MIMNNSKYFYGACLILVLMIVACSFKQKEKPIDPELLPGKYYKDVDSRDSIFIYPDKTYKHTFHRKDGTVDSQTSTWYFKPEINDLFFERFVFYTDMGSSEFTGTWPPHVFVTEEGQVKLQYSERVYYLKVKEK